MNRAEFFCVGLVAFLVFGCFIIFEHARGVAPSESIISTTVGRASCAGGGIDQGDVCRASKEECSEGKTLPSCISLEETVGQSNLTNARAYATSIEWGENYGNSEYDCPAREIFSCKWYWYMDENGTITEECGMDDKGRPVNGGTYESISFSC